MLLAIATIIRRRRLEQNLSQEKFARMLGVKVELLAEIETGEIDIDIAELYGIAAALNTSCGDISKEAEYLTREREFRQYRMRRKLTTLKQIATLQRQHKTLQAQLDRIDRQRKDIIARDGDVVYDGSATDKRRKILQASEQRLSCVKQQQEEQDRFMLRFLANRASKNTNGELLVALFPAQSLSQQSE